METPLFVSNQSLIIKSKSLPSIGTGRSQNEQLTQVASQKSAPTKPLRASSNREGYDFGRAIGRLDYGVFNHYADARFCSRYAEYR